MDWVGTRKIAFIPTYRPRAIPPDQIPDRWEEQILRRVLHDPVSGADRSLRAWLRAASSGRADVDPVVLPMRTIDQQAVPPDVFEGELGGTLRDQGFHHAAIVMLGGPGAGTNAGFWSRFVMLEGVGVWLMEILHGVTGFGDLYPFGNDVDPGERAIGEFDEMSSMNAVHPTIYTKLGMGWADAGRVVRQSAPVADHQLQLVGLTQPPAAGMASAVRVGDEVPYLMIEARARVDQFEKSLPSEGVIAYRVQTTSPLGQRQDRKLPLWLHTRTAVKPGESVVLDDGVVLRVTAAVPGGYAVRVEQPAVHHIDLTEAVGARGAAGPPSSMHVPPLDVDNVSYRSSDGHLHEIWRSPGGQGTTDLTANAGAPAAASDPFAYVAAAESTVVLIYRATDNNVRSLYWWTGQVGHDNLTGSIGAPRAVGNPVAWMDRDNVHHVCYRSSNGHLHELWWQGPSAVGHGDLTAAAGAVSAAGDASAYFDGARSTHIVTFRGTDNHVRALYWSGGPVGQDDLSGYAGTPAAAGDPAAYFSAVDDTHHVVYRTGNGHLIELSWPNVAPVSGRDLTAETGAPPATGTPAVGHNPADNTHHVFYRAVDGTLRELWRFVGQSTWHHENLTAAYGGPPAADRPTYWVRPTAPHQHLAYRGTDGHVHELLW